MFSVLRLILTSGLIASVIRLVSNYFTININGDEKARRVRQHLVQVNASFTKMSEGFLSMVVQIVYEYLKARR